MRRLTLSTLLGLMALWAVANAIGVDRTTASWSACLLSEQHVELAVRNENTVPWDRFSLMARVYQGKTLAATTSFLQETKPLAAQAETRFKLPLTKKLTVGEAYRVEVYLQRKGSPLVRKVFDERPATQISQATTTKKVAVIPEPRSMRDLIQPINVRKAMGIP
ncbi:MAG TPA: hypothetical protein PKO06_04840 [Candidatus Ozemobacteraceae bacterium]|nr:hypothetical protein [Candidatus Ozemobacteraceae bacterium]